MPNRRPEARLMRQKTSVKCTAEEDADRKQTGKATGPLSPRGSRPEAGLRGQADGSGARDGTRKHARSGRESGNANLAATAPATARPMWSGTADAAGLKAEPERRNPLAGETGRGKRTGGPHAERMGSKGQGTAEGRGELRRWKARVPAAATVGAGSNADPHFVLGSLLSAVRAGRLLSLALSPEGERASALPQLSCDLLKVSGGAPPPPSAVPLPERARGGIITLWSVVRALRRRGSLRCGYSHRTRPGRRGWVSVFPARRRCTCRCLCRLSPS